MTSIMAVIEDISHYLKNLGFSSKEQEIYKALFEFGDLSITELSKITRIPRTSVYRNSNNLIIRNFIESITDEFGNNKLRVIDPSKLFDIVDKKREDLAKIEKAITSLKKIAQNNPLKIAKTEIKYFYGVDGMRQLIWNSLEAKEPILGYSTWGREQLIGLNFEHKLIREMSIRGKTDKVIINMKGVNYLRSIKPDGYHEFQTVRVIEDIEIIGDIYIYNDIYAINNWDVEKKEVIGVEIKNPDITKVQKSIFNKLWQSAKPVSNYL